MADGFARTTGSTVIRALRRAMAVALTVGIGHTIGAGCSSSEVPAPPPSGGEQGESCQSRRDCIAGLACISQVCVVNTGGILDGGQLGLPGESCLTRPDCAPGLACIENVCIGGYPEGGALPRTPGQRGESCASRTDCAVGLSCVKNACAPSDLGLSPTGKECVKVQCRVPTDCCGFEGQCPARRRECLAGLDASCGVFNDLCACDTTETWDCKDYQCVARAAPATPCTDEAGAACGGSVALGYCNGAYCVECMQSTNCTTRPICSGKLCNCVEEKCVVVCASDLDCPSQQKCMGKRCVMAECATDRECIASTGNTFSICDTGKCRIACATDATCNDATAKSVQLCVGGFCQDAGCETKEECRILFQKQGLVTINLLDIDCLEKKK